MLAMTVAIIKSAVRDLGSENQAERLSALQYFNGENFQKDCRLAAIDCEAVIKKVEGIVQQDGIRQKKLIRDLVGEVNEYA